MTEPNGETCEVLDLARELLGTLDGYALPADWRPDSEWYNEILAEVRHAYTNYEESLRSLPLCTNEIEAGRCTWDPEQESWCSIKAQAHDLLKRAAKDIAAKLYQAWQEQQKSTGKS